MRKQSMEQKMKRMKEEYNKINVPSAAKERILEGTQRAKNEKRKKKRIQSYRWIGVAALLAMLIGLPNMNASVAHAMGNMPLLGGFFRLVTFREYSYESETHNAEVHVGKLEYQEQTKDSDEQMTTEGNMSNSQQAETENAVQENVQSGSEQAEKTVEQINEDIEKITSQLIVDFEDSLQQEGHKGLTINTDVITDNEKYYTLKLSVLEIQASGYFHSKYYTIDKATGNLLSLKDLFGEDSNYIAVISDNIKLQMREQMAADEANKYFLDEKDFPEFNFTAITPDADFYFNHEGELVIAFDEYEVAPGYMGAPEFVIAKDVTDTISK